MNNFMNETESVFFYFPPAGEDRWEVRPGESQSHNGQQGGETGEQSQEMDLLQISSPCIL